MKPSTRILLMQKRLLTPIFLGSRVALWLDAADSRTIILNSSTASDWRDKSTNRYIFSQPTAVNQPTYTTSGIAFNGNNWFNPISISLPNFSIMMVETATQNTAVVYYPIGFTSGQTGVSVGGNFNSQRFSIFNGTTALVTSQTSVLNAPTILFGGSDNTGRQISINGNAPTTDTITQAITQITIGARGDSAWPFVGRISEIVVIDALLSTTDRQRLEGYLAHKWRLTANLPNNHPFKFRPPYM